MDAFIILLIVCGVVGVCVLTVNNHNRAFTEGRMEGVRQMQNQAVTQQYGEFYIDHEGEKQFRWVCSTIVERPNPAFDPPEPWPRR